MHRKSGIEGFDEKKEIFFFVSAEGVWNRQGATYWACSCLGLVERGYGGAQTGDFPVLLNASGPVGSRLAVRFRKSKSPGRS